MLGSQVLQGQKCPVIDIEMQQHRREHRLNADVEPDDGPRMAVLQALFGFTSEQMQQVRDLPTIISWCRYLEDCFQLFLTEQYSGIWSTLEIPKPHAGSHCWALFLAVSRAVINLDDADYSIEDVWRSVKPLPDTDLEGEREGEGLIMLADVRDDECLIAVFAVICWGSMILQPNLTWSDDTAAAAAPRLAIHQLPSNQGLKMDFVHRPIVAVFRNFQKALARRELTRKPVTRESTILFVSTLNYHSLRTIGKVSLKWVDNLSCHLNFDSRTRTLSIFRFPSFCALATIKGDRGVLYEELVRALFSADDEDAKEFACALQLSQEVLMSYRLLFGQSRAARGIGKTLLRNMEDKHDYDQLLVCLCTEPHRKLVKNLPESFWPVSCRDFDNVLQEHDSYSSRDDFPMLGSRLAAIQEFNLRQQPSQLRDLWRDRRNPLQWYTFWAVLVIGGLSIILAILQLIAAILAVV